MFSVKMRIGRAGRIPLVRWQSSVSKASEMREGVELDRKPKRIREDSYQIRSASEEKRKASTEIDDLLDVAIGEKRQAGRVPSSVLSSQSSSSSSNVFSARRDTEERLRSQRNSLPKKESSLIVDRQRKRQTPQRHSQKVVNVPLSAKDQATLLGGAGGSRVESPKPKRLTRDDTMQRESRERRRRTEASLREKGNGGESKGSSLIIDNSPLSKSDEVALLGKFPNLNSDFDAGDDRSHPEKSKPRHRPAQQQYASRLKSGFDRSKTPRKTQDSVAMLRVSGTTVTIGRLAAALRTSVETVEAALVALGEKAPEVKGHKKRALANERRIDADVAELVALEMGRELKLVRARSRSAEEESETEKNLRALDTARIEALKESRPERPASDSKEWTELPLRPPVVAVMGHVDHGKTTLLDSLRGSHVAEAEAGGITQRLSAFCVGKTTFIDTPGHAAFARMRSSSAAALDVALIVIAADDGIKQQTLEALELARARRAAVVFAMTKIDKFTNEEALEEAASNIRNQVASHGFTTEADGGECPLVPVSGKTGKGLDELKETLEAQAEILDLRADPKNNAEATVVDAVFDKHLGLCADVIVAWGTLKVGDHVVVGECAGKVRRIDGVHDDDAKSSEKGAKKKKVQMLKAVGPSTPCRVAAALTAAGHQVNEKAHHISAGDVLLTVKNEKTAHKIALANFKWRHARELADADKEMKLRAAVVAQEQQAQRAANQHQRRGRRSGQLMLSKNAALQTALKKKSHSEEKDDQDHTPTVPIIAKVSSEGEVDALKLALTAVPEDKVHLELIGDVGVGDVSRHDIDLAETFEAPIFAWNVGLSAGDAREAARRAKVDVRRHSIIYSLIDDVKAHAAALLPKTLSTQVTSWAEVLQIFELSDGTKILGSRVHEGAFHKSEAVRVLRDGVQIYAEPRGAHSLRHFKKDVAEIAKGQECGIALREHKGDEHSSVLNFQPGDRVETFKVIESASEL